MSKIFSREVDYPVFYQGNKVGSRRADFVIFNKVLVELKAIGKLEQNHFAQILNYLKAYRLQVGLLINFGTSSLQWKRVVATGIRNTISENQNNHLNQ